MLFQYFTEKYPQLNVKYKTYWQEIQQLNISFSKLGLEECKTCLIYKKNRNRELTSKYKNDGVDYILGKLVNEVDCVCNDCEISADFKKHIERANLSREEYRKYVRGDSSTEFVTVATDLKKVIMLPRLPGVKTVVFTRCLATYQLTFALVGGISQRLGETSWNDMAQCHYGKE